MDICTQTLLADGIVQHQCVNHICTICGWTPEWPDRSREDLIK